jgi:transcription-repair coupling factor
MQKSDTLPPNLTAQAFFIANLPHHLLSGGVLWFLPSSHDLGRARELIKFFTKLNKISTELLTFPDDFVYWLKYQNDKTPTIMFVVPDHINLALPTKKDIATHTVKISAGENKAPFALIRELESAGFEPGPLPDATGWFLKQGGAITIASATEAWRIDFNSNIIEDIFKFNLATGLTCEKIKNITLLPQKLTPHSEITLKKYLTNQITLIAPPSEIVQTGKNTQLVSLLKPSNLFGSVPLFGKQWPEITSYLQEKNTKGKNVVIFTNEPQTILANLVNLTYKPKIIEVGESIVVELEGFENLSEKTIYLTDRELIGLKRKRTFASLASFEHLAIDDYLVHIDHGIGRFRGLTSQTIDNIAREYFLVEYAEEDKLYVPIEHTDRLSRYLGEPHPKVERLHSASWFQITKKVKAEAASLARELLNLYARRQKSKVKPWQHFPEEEILAANFPWPLTPDQLKAWSEISADLDRTMPMDRLICGDVGFGKTELAVRTTLRAALNNYQIALLTPTTILAQQHFDTFSERLEKLGVKLGLISRAQTASTIKQTLTDAAAGKIDIIIGTHRLLARDVHFKNLGLLIIDEEQRFGVKQKEELKAVKPEVHVLSLSATPIPRTLNLAVSNVRDLSIITTPPTGRQGVVMEFCAPHEATIKRAIEQELTRGGQIYYLVNHISKLPQIELKLKKLLPHLKLGTIHGRLNPREVAQTMHAFDKKELQLLLATTIIENGLDLPNVNTLIVEGAENFGLSDLYQLRGRVGRGRTRAYAYFLVKDSHTQAASKRLEALSQAPALGGGLTIALKDLELRGAGAILGKEQHGQVSAVGLHLYGQLLAQAVEELQTGESLPNIPEVLLRLPLEGRIHTDLIPIEANRIQVYQRLAGIREPAELKIIAEEIIGRPLTSEPADRLLQNLLTLLEIKLLAERARLGEVSCQTSNGFGQFTLRFLEAPSVEIIERLTSFDSRWGVEPLGGGTLYRHTEGGAGIRAKHPLAVGAWIPWLKQSLKLLGK